MVFKSVARAKVLAKTDFENYSRLGSYLDLRTTVTI